MLVDFGPKISERLSRRSGRLQIRIENADGIVQETRTFHRQVNAVPEFEHPDELVRSELERGRRQAEQPVHPQPQRVQKPPPARRVILPVVDLVHDHERQSVRYGLTERCATELPEILPEGRTLRSTATGALPRVLHPVAEPRVDIIETTPSSTYVAVVEAHLVAVQCFPPRYRRSPQIEVRSRRVGRPVGQHLEAQVHRELEVVHVQ